ncbi:hypothetical protein D9M69_538510 [compost metagenome]
MVVDALAHELLRAVGRDAHDTAARIGRPQRSVALGQDALGALQVLAHIADGRAVHRETVQGIGRGHFSNTRLSCGKTISSSNTPTMIKVNGAVPRKMSPRVMRGSLSELLTT